MELSVYFSFNGNCKEALEFYKSCLGGEIEFMQTYESNKEISADIPKEWYEKILHASFRSGNIFFMASDVMPSGNGPCSETIVYEGSPISLSLNFATEKEEIEIFNKFAEGGTITMPLQDTFWNAKFGMLTDKFGIKWMFNCEKSTA
jgi:PhnB protein